MSSLQDLREALEYAGLKQESAERLAYALQSRDFLRDNLATREDLLILENKLEKQIFSVKSEVKGQIFSIKSEVKGEISILKEEIHKVENKILWWIVSGIGLTIVTQIVLNFIGNSGLN